MKKNGQKNGKKYTMKNGVRKQKKIEEEGVRRIKGPVYLREIKLKV